jgi:hypothetical protein
MSQGMRPVSPDEVPPEVRVYMTALQPLGVNPFVQKHFSQITQLVFAGPDGQQAAMFALEFRVGPEAALVWTDGQGNWGTGGWLALAHADAEIVTPPSALTMDYFQNAKPVPSLGDAIEQLIESD